MVRELSSVDRCDTGACNAQAWVRATFSTGDLLFCRRHYLQFQVDVDRQAMVVLDESEHINARSESSA
jgi:hypothetical protein